MPTGDIFYDYRFHNAQANTVILSAYDNLLTANTFIGSGANRYPDPNSQVLTLQANTGLYYSNVALYQPQHVTVYSPNDVERMLIAAQKLLEGLRAAKPKIDEICEVAAAHGIEYHGPDLSNNIKELEKELSIAAKYYDIR